MKSPTPDSISAFLRELGRRCTFPAEIYIFGGSAVMLIGGRRNTIDVDFTISVTPRQAEAFRQLISTLAREQDLDLEESIPSEFTPLPSDANRRHQLIGEFGHMKAYVFDPYSIALMKLDRGFPTDIEDVHFLLRNAHVEMELLEQCVTEVEGVHDEGPHLRRHFDEMKRTL